MISPTESGFTRQTPPSLPTRRSIYRGGAWHPPVDGRKTEVISPATGASLGEVADGSALDAEAAIASAREGFGIWRRVQPMERARILRQIAARVRDHAEELALIDAADCGNPVTAVMGDVTAAAAQLDFFAGLVTEMKGQSVPLGPDCVNFSVREPRGVVAKILPFNHPFMFCAGKIAAPLAAGNTVVVKPPEQSPLSSLRFAELIDGMLPPGVFNLVPGGRDVGEVFSSHPDVAMVSLIGSVNTGRAVMQAASRTIKPVLLELGGKNALIAYPDADPAEVGRAMAEGMNFTWCGQSCGSTSRAFIHASIYEAALDHARTACGAYRPGLPTSRETTMGAMISRRQYDQTLAYIASGRSQGARLVTGGRPPQDPALANGFFIEPTIFADVTADMTIASEEIFGPVLAVARWDDEMAMLNEVNVVRYGLTCSIWTNDLRRAHLAAQAVEAGYVWVNEVARHFLGTPFGGYKQSGLGREECLEELLCYTQEKNIHIRLTR